MGIDSRNIQVLAGEAKTQRETLSGNTEAIRILQAQVAQLKIELNNIGQELNILKYSKGVGRTV